MMAKGILIGIISVLTIEFVLLLILQAARFYVHAKETARELDDIKWRTEQEYLVREKGYSWITCLGQRVACPPPPTKIGD
jgi:hypothetical protein